MLSTYLCGYPGFFRFINLIIVIAIKLFYDYIIRKLGIIIIGGFIMKKNKLLGIFVATFLAATGTLLTSQHQIKAATIADVVVTARLYTSDGVLIQNRALGEYSSWLVGKIGFIDGAKYYQVATNEYVKASTVDNLTGDRANSEDFDFLGTYKPDTKKISEYFVKYVNALHAANGTQPVHTTADLENYAFQRADQQTGDYLDHSTAGRSMNENLNSSGLDYLRKWGYVHSDKDVAYYELKDWYDDTYNYISMGNPGHFGHRANLIYAGPTIAMGINNLAASYVADPVNAYTNPAFDQLLNYTGTNPNTKFISKDSI